MRRFIVLAIVCGISPSARAADGAPPVRDTEVSVGETPVVVRVTSRPGSPLVYVNMHDDENTAVEAAGRVIVQSGGTLVELRHTGFRRIALQVRESDFTFDPNRIFTPDGIRRTLDSKTPTADAAAEQVSRFAGRLREFYGTDTANVLIALHNNGEGGLSIQSYQPGGGEALATAEVFANKDHDPDDFILVTHRGLFDALKKRKFNVALQDNVRAPDDGSLSVYCGRHGLPYANVEAQVGHLDEQVAMIRALASAIDEVKPKREATATPPSQSGVRTGIDVLSAEGFARLKGRRVGLVTNHTGRAADGTPTIDLLARADGVKLVALFGPEHGIRGEKDEKIGDSTDAKTGLPVYSLYGVRRKPTADTLRGIDTLVYDIQDVGCRFYTYISTLGLVLEAAKENGVKVIVLDRPNPIGGLAVEGPVRDPGRGSFVAFHELPVRHGMTVGELATLFNTDRGVGADLEVVRMTGWRRCDLYDRAGLTWHDPSPNMRHLTAALLYSGIGLLELTNVSVGRGTERPFEWVGAPWIDSRKLAAELSRRDIPGVRFVPVSRTPTASVHKAKECGGVDVIASDWDAVRPVRLGLEIAATLRSLYPQDWDAKNFDHLLVHRATCDGLLGGTPVVELERAWQPAADGFRKRRAAALLYPE